MSISTGREQKQLQIALSSFCNWAVESGRMLDNPLKKNKRADEKSDQRRKRRALTEPEIHRLLFVARWRPLAEHGRETEHRKATDRPENSRSRKTWKKRQLTFKGMESALQRAQVKLADKPELIAELDRKGLERVLIYKLAILTGLRRGEIASLTLAHLHLDVAQPFVRMRAQDTKNSEAVDIPLQNGLADDLRQWQIVRLACSGGNLSAPLFNVPKQFVKTMDRDLKAAGIPKVDQRGRTVDVHALRHTFGTMLSKNGVAPRTAQQAMRHSNVDLTMNVYTDSSQIDTATAVNSLPHIPVPVLPQIGSHVSVSTGDDQKSVAHRFAHNPVLHITQTFWVICGHYVAR